MENTKRRHPILRAILAIILLLILVVVGYFIYVFASFHRIEDNVVLEVEDPIAVKAQTGVEYSILTWNMGFGAYSDDYSFFMDGGKYSRAFSKEATIDNITAMVTKVTEISPDFVYIQEVDTDSTRSYHVDEKTLIQRYLTGYTSVFAQNYDSPYLFYPIFCPHGKSVAGIMTAAKYNIESSLRRQLPIETGVMKLLDLDRCYSVTRVPVEGGKTLCLYNMHLSAYTSDGTIATEQLQMLIADMEKEHEAGNYIICGGDFNKDLLGNSAEVFGVSGDDFTWAQPIPSEMIPSWLTKVACSNAPSCRNADRPYDETNFVLTIDGFLVSDNIQITFAEVIDLEFKNSDHNPVIMKFILE